MSMTIYVAFLLVIKLVVISILLHLTMQFKPQESLLYVPGLVCAVLLTSTVPTVAPVSLFTPVMEVIVAVFGFFLMIRLSPRSTLFPFTSLFRSVIVVLAILL